MDTVSGQMNDCSKNWLLQLLHFDNRLMVINLFSNYSNFTDCSPPSLFPLLDDVHLFATTSSPMFSLSASIWLPLFCAMNLSDNVCALFFWHFYMRYSCLQLKRAHWPELVWMLATMRYQSVNIYCTTLPVFFARVSLNWSSSGDGNVVNLWM